MNFFIRVGACASVALIAAAGPALAGGYAVQEQSAQFQGSSFAGAAAGGGLSSMFWNPAAVNQAGAGLTTNSNYTAILGDVRLHANPGSTGLGVPGTFADSGVVSKDALVPASYGAYRLSPSMVLGASFNAPFGLVTKPENRGWAGQTFGTTSSIKTYNLNAVLGVNLGNGVSIAVGPQVEYMQGKLKSATSFSPAAANVAIDADNTGVGFTAGILWEASPATSIGLGFRSSVSHDLKGDLAVTSNEAVTRASASANVKTPEILTLSGRQALTPQLTALGTFEWTNWTRLQSLDVACDSVALAGPCNPPAGKVLSTRFNWKSGYLFSGGLEYAFTNTYKVRGGLAYEISPIQNDADRSVRVPDTDRIWASTGLSFGLTPSTNVDLAYSHVFGLDSKINRTEGAVTLNADVKASVDIVSVGLKTKW
jgi:long-chain fatty acid transport protein